MWSVAATGFSLTVNRFVKTGVGISDPAEIHLACQFSPRIPHCQRAGALQALSPAFVQVLTCQ